MPLFILIFKLFNSISFLNSPILIYDPESNQRIQLEHESVIFQIHKTGLSRIEIMKTNPEDCKQSDCLYIHLESVNSIKLSKLKVITTKTELIEMLNYNCIEGLIQNTGFLVPLKYLDKASFPDDNKICLLEEFKSITNEVFKARFVDLKINLLDDVLKLNLMFPDSASRVNYLFDNLHKTVLLRNTNGENIRYLGLLEPRFSKIGIYHRLSPDEFQLFWELLRSQRTRFNLVSIETKFNLLSELLTALSLCADCPELKFIEFDYLKPDLENKQEVIDKAIKDFRKKFGIIEYLGLN